MVLLVVYITQIFLLFVIFISSPTESGFQYGELYADSLVLFYLLVLFSYSGFLFFGALKIGSVFMFGLFIYDIILITTVNSDTWVSSLQKFVLKGSFLILLAYSSYFYEKDVRTSFLHKIEMMKEWMRTAEVIGTMLPFDVFVEFKDAPQLEELAKRTIEQTNPDSLTAPISATQYNSVTVMFCYLQGFSKHLHLPDANRPSGFANQMHETMGLMYQLHKLYSEFDRIMGLFEHIDKLESTGGTYLVCAGKIFILSILRFI